MGVRHWLMMMAMMAMMASTALLLAACTSPGKPFAYHDLKVSLGPSATPAQPATTQAATISFTLRNTWNQPVTGVRWILRETTVPLSPVVIDGNDADDPVTIAAFDRVVINVDLGTPNVGKHTYEVEVDPGNDVVEDDETNNTSTTLTVVTADQDISFGTPAPALTWPTSPNTTDQPTLNFTLNYTINPAVTPPGSAVTVPYNITVQNTPDDTPVAVVPISATPPANVDPLGTIPLPVSVILPATAIGTYIYTITLSPADGDDGNLNNNTATVTVVVPAPG